MAIKGIDHWVIVAGDLDRTLDFYQRLGFAIVWEPRAGRPGRWMPTIRLNEAQKINVHGPDWPERPGYLGARRPAVGAAGPGTRSCARGPSTSVYFRDPDDNLVEFTVYGQAT